MKSREEMINALVEDRLDSIASNGSAVIKNLLLEGFAGYNNMTDAQILRDYKDSELEDEEDES